MYHRIHLIHCIRGNAVGLCRSVHGLLVHTICCLLLVSCARHTAQLSGTISVAEAGDAIAGELTVLLTDISSEDEAAVIARSSTAIKTLPTRYELAYEPALINPKHRYTLSAQLRRDGVVQYATDTAYEVLSGNAGTATDLVLVATGKNGVATVSTVPDELFNGELRSANEVTLYRAGFQQGQLLWIEEERAAGQATPLRARYELKGAYLMHYSDNASVEIRFTAQGKPEAILRSGALLDLNSNHNLIDDARNRVAMLRSMVLANQESQQHRQQTEQLSR